MASDLLSSLFDDIESHPLTVSELNLQIRSELEQKFSDIWVEGEIVNFAAVGSGHWYFTLHDGSTQIKAACFKASNWRIRFKPFDGLQVRVRGKITVYEPRGEYQLSVESLEPVGEGALKVAYEQIKAKLEAEGLFDEELKRPLPMFPRKIGVVTSPTGAAFFDILHVISRRARSVRVVLIPTRVQGETAGEEIRLAINAANAFNNNANAAEKLDVLIVGRGGGSSEDLWSFNEERVARAIRGSVIPVISAVGHEIDFTIADLVADVRAATPSAAAELVAAREEDILVSIGNQVRSLVRNIENRILQYENDLQTLALSPVFAEFPGRVESLKCRVYDTIDDLGRAAAEWLRILAERLDRADRGMTPLLLRSRIAKISERLSLTSNRNQNAYQTVLSNRNTSLLRLMAKLDTLSPLSVLHRGYSITETAAGDIVRDSKQVSAGDKLKIKLASGKLEAEVMSSDNSE
jgi:exodeoxyribonuclease VII large subunit